MRKIEQRIIEAIYTSKPFSSGNTRVECAVKPMGMVSSVYLHGNLIAEVCMTANRLNIYDGGWESVTTKSRLNAILSKFAPGYGIVQRDWKWYIANPGELSNNASRQWNGKAEFVYGTCQAS